MSFSYLLLSVCAQRLCAVFKSEGASGARKGEMGGRVSGVRAGWMEAGSKV